MSEPNRSKDYVLDDQVGYLLRLAYQRHMSIFSERIVGGLTAMQFSTLYRLRSEPGRISQNALGRLVGMDAATTKGVLSRLLARDLVRIDLDPDDRRRHILSTTEAGRALLDQSFPYVQQISEETLAPLTPDERTQFVALLKKLL